MVVICGLSRKADDTFETFQVRFWCSSKNIESMKKIIENESIPMKPFNNIDVIKAVPPM